MVQDRHKSRVQKLTSLLLQGKAKKTRKFATVKRMLSPNDARLWVSFEGIRSINVHTIYLPQKRESIETEEEGGGGKSQSCSQNVSYCLLSP